MGVHTIGGFGAQVFTTWKRKGWQGSQLQVWITVSGGGGAGGQAMGQQTMAGRRTVEGATGQALQGLQDIFLTRMVYKIQG